MVRPMGWRRGDRTGLIGANVSSNPAYLGSLSISSAEQNKSEMNENVRGLAQSPENIARWRKRPNANKSRVRRRH